MLVKVEPSDSGGSFESTIVPRIRQTLLEPSKLQVGTILLWIFCVVITPPCQAVSFSLEIVAVFMKTKHLGSKFFI